MQGRSRCTQQGVALAVSLIFLVLITIIGVSSIRGTTLNEMMTTNTQQASSTYQAAESVIASLWDFETIVKYTPEQLINPPLAEINQLEGHQPYDDFFDIDVLATSTNASAIMDFTAKATIQYCHEDQHGSKEDINDSINSTTPVNHVYSLHGIASLAATGAAANHNLHVFIKRPPAGRQGNCP